MIVVKVLTVDDDLQLLVDEINAASWDDTNDMSTYDVESLSYYLECQDTVFVACHELSAGRRTLMGFASSRVEIKPYGKERWLYVDEVDVCTDERRKGAGVALMKKLFSIAKQRNCTEVWLGTEVANDAANALYQSINPHDVAQVIGYTYVLTAPERGHSAE